MNNMYEMLIILSCVATAALAIESNFYHSELCNQVEGYCVLEAECPGAVDTADKELCPTDKSQGAVCCRNFPQDKVNCYQQHNGCMKTCPKKIDLGRKGCSKETTCCILL